MQGVFLHLSGEDSSKNCIYMPISKLGIMIYLQLWARRVHPEGIQCSLNHPGNTHQGSHPGQTRVRNSTEICFIHKYSSVLVVISRENVLSMALIIFRKKNPKLIAKPVSIHCKSTNYVQLSLYSVQPQNHKLLWTFFSLFFCHLSFAKLSSSAFLQIHAFQGVLVSAAFSDYNFFCVN